MDWTQFLSGLGGSKGGGGGSTGWPISSSARNSNVFGNTGTDYGPLILAGVGLVVLALFAAILLRR